MSFLTYYFQIPAKESLEMRTRVSLGITLLLVLVGIRQASAETMVYTDRASFEAATTDATTVAWDGYAAAGTYKRVTGAVTKGIVTDTSVKGSFFAWNGASGWPTPEGIHDGGSGSTISLAVNSYHALGADVQGCGTGYATVAGKFILSDATEQAFSVVLGDAKGFIGLVSTNPAAAVTSMVFYSDALGTPGRGAPSVFNTTYGNAVPEPSACVLAVVGMVGLLAYAWRKRR